MSDDTPHPSPRDRRDVGIGWWVVAAGIVLVVVVGAIWVIVAGGGDGAATPSPPSPSATSGTQPSSQPSNPGTTMPTAPDGSPGGACGQATGPGSASTQIPTGPPAADWRLVGGVALPFSKEFGPRTTTDAMARCFAHSPTGAVFAAAQITMRLGLPGRDKVLRDQVEAGPGRDELLSQPPPLLSAPFPQWAGFKVVAAAGDQATVQLVQRVISQGRELLLVHTTQLNWAAGDWKVDLDPPGGRVDPFEVNDTSSYISWGGA